MAHIIHSPTVFPGLLSEHIVSEKIPDLLVIIGLLGVFVVSVGVYGMIRTRIMNKNRVAAGTDDETIPAVVVESSAGPTVEEPSLVTDLRPSSIQTFGGFRVIDRDGVDLTRGFSPRILQLFLLVLFHSHKDGEGGIDTDQLTSILWPDALPHSAKNSRGVAVRTVRDLLEKLDGVTLVHRHGVYALEVRPEAHCDYLRFEQLRRRFKSAHEAGDIDIFEEMLDLAGRGGLLPQLSYPWLDAIRGELIQALPEIVLDPSILSGNNELVIRAADVVLGWDSLNEDAFRLKVKHLHLLGQHGTIKAVYRRFCTEYETTFEKPYPVPLQSLLQ